MSIQIKQLFFGIILGVLPWVGLFLFNIYIHSFTFDESKRVFLKIILPLIIIGLVLSIIVSSLYFYCYKKDKELSQALIGIVLVVYIICCLVFSYLFTVAMAISGSG